MDKKTVPLVVLAIVLCAVLVLGEALTYGINTHSFNVKAEFSSGTLNYSVSSRGSDTYSVVVLDDNNVQSTEELYIYVDERYDDYYEQAIKKNSMGYYGQQYCSEQVEKFLKIRGFDNVKTLNSKELTDFINNTASDPKGKGLLVTSFALPSGIYTGNGSDKIFEWIDNGGNLYWSTSEIGKFYTDTNGLNEVTGNQSLFLGKECVNTGKLENATSVVGNDFKDALTLLNSGLRYSVNTDGIPNSLSIGYCEDGYSSISFMKHGNGMICIIGAMSEIIPFLDDISQIIASKITYATEIVDCIKGNVARGTVDGKMDFSVTGNATAYIYIGGTYTVYGRCFVDQ